MDVYDAVRSRRAVRAFTDQLVPRQTLERVLEAAAMTPSSGNLQPWRLIVVTGRPLDELKSLATARALSGDPGDERQFPMYPDPLAPPYVERFAAGVVQRNRAFGIEPNDPDRPMKVAALNTQAFGAPVVVFCYVDRSVGAAQWMDAGLHLQTVMLLLRGEGLDSCPQVMWTMYRTSVAEVVGAGPDLVLLCGLAVGYARDTVPTERPARARIDETVTFVGG